MINNLSFHHIGVATSDIEKAIEVYKKLGYRLVDEIITDPIQHVRICFMYLEKHPLVELVAPIDETSPVHKILKKSNATPYHTCYEVDNIEESISAFKQIKFILISKPVPAIAFAGRSICFLFHQHIGLVELLEKSC
ncbi:MAG: lactoylglutathione lyase [Segetibacter sp.]|nr:lactoylglutathione lyase [Segetibacter sp.]